MALAGELFARPLGRSLRLIGGLAIRAHAGAAARVTHDVDLAVADAAANAELRRSLEADGWKIGDAGAYWRAKKEGMPMVDVFSSAVVNPRTFETINLREPAVERELGGRRVLVAAPHDLALLKLCAARDQDAIDLAILTSIAPLDPRRIVASAERDDVEIRLAEGAQRFRLVMRGGLAALGEELLDRPLTETEISAFSLLLDGLEREGC